MKILCPFIIRVFFFVVIAVDIAFLFFMSCDNVQMMCISFLFIELSSNQVCFVH